jgi:hypothetical protein
MHTAGIYLERLRKIVKSVSTISDPEPSTSCMQVTTVTDYDKFLNREVIMRKLFLLRNQLLVTFSAILKVTAVQLGV